MKFSILSSQDDEDKATVKSRVVKKNLNPQWNETLFLRLNGTSGKTLKVLVKDWNRLSKSAPLGEVNISLDDLKPNQIKQFAALPLQNGKGTISLSLMFKMSVSSNVYILFGEQRIKYELFRNVKLATQLDLLCQMLGSAEKWEDFILWYNDKVLTDAMLKDPHFEIPEGSDLKLNVRPNLQVNSVLEQLKNGTAEGKKKAMFDLKKQLEVCVFFERSIRSFILNSIFFFFRMQDLHKLLSKRMELQ